ncbi:phosphotransferase [Leucobacter insecticola]|uniref:Phosphotransferase n=1 Tax=Leucobacter insecticola TaxID=2714934 RepID=A0A6G8FKA7_9MICO|nr:phosphotransferase [Leucobacter insecticola]QIM16805.1 phosphotransferase [Leucobacter insecticola]
MASIPFTLAALATSAVPGLVVLGTRAHGEDEEYVSAVVTDGNDEFVVRIPRTQAAEIQQSAELLSLAALNEGARSVLPFAVPESLGVTRAGDSRAVVTTFIDGGQFDIESLAEDSLLIQPLAETLAAIHNLPHQVAQQGGLPIRSATDARLQATRLIDRAEATRLLPQTIQDRWKHVVETSELWDFAPAVIHGSLDASQLRVSNDSVTGVLGWSELSVGDPAADLAWLLGAGSDVFEAVLVRYAALRDQSMLTQLHTRAALYHELEIARWLLHGVESHDDSITSDAVGMLDRLVDSVGVFGTVLGAAETGEPLSEDEVVSLLEETPEVTDHLSETAAFEALDEDRMFGIDTDFIEPLRETGEDESEASDTQLTEPIDDQLTEPIDDDDLPEAIDDEDLPEPPQFENPFQK